MEIFKFKTNIHCGGCVVAVTPALNSLQGVDKWEVDTDNPDKILSVQSNGGISSAEIISVLKQKGYDARMV